MGFWLCAVIGKLGSLPLHRLPCLPCCCLQDLTMVHKCRPRKHLAAHAQFRGVQQRPGRCCACRQDRPQDCAEAAQGVRSRCGPAFSHPYIQKSVSFRTCEPVNPLFPLLRSAYQHAVMLRSCCILRSAACCMSSRRPTHSAACLAATRIPLGCLKDACHATAIRPHACSPP